MLIRSCRRIIVKTRDSSDEIFNVEDCDTIGREYFYIWNAGEEHASWRAIEKAPVTGC